MVAKGFDETSPEYEAVKWRAGIARMIHGLSAHEYAAPVDSSDHY